MIFMASHAKYEKETATFWLQFHANVDCRKIDSISRNVCSDHVITVEF